MEKELKALVVVLLMAALLALIPAFMVGSICTEKDLQKALGGLVGKDLSFVGSVLQRSTLLWALFTLPAFFVTYIFAGFLGKRLVQRQESLLR